MAAMLSSSSSPGHLGTLTRTGALVGTPAYMAPEQILAEATSERTDQFSFCVALYEALYGERPFTGESLLQLLHNVSRGNLAPVSEDHEVPAWIRRALVRGLRSEPRERWPSMAALMAALEDDPADRHRRWFLFGVGIAVVLATLLVGAQTIHHRRQELERQIAAHLQAAAEASTDGRTRAAALRELRQRAFAAFDGRDRVQGEALWRLALAAVAEVEGAYTRAEQAYETALVLNSDRADLRGQLADLIVEDRLLANELRRAERARSLDVLLDRYDDGTRRRFLSAPGAVSVDVNPRAAVLTLERYRIDPTTGSRTLEPAGPLHPDGALTSVPPGSYRLQASAPGFTNMVYPFEVARGDSRTLQLALLPATAVTAGFIYVGAGEFWFGDGDEQLRTQFLDTAPLHRRATDGYLIARNEVTFREWIAFLAATPAGERALLSPRAPGGTRGWVQLREDESGWQLVFQPATRRYTAREGEPIVYAGRKTLASQDWLDFPVSGVSAQDAQRYLAWLRATGRVPAARLCTELEWERAARGADDRVYPNGDQLRPQDANFDLTYGRLGSAYGPDVVGSHPAIRSPFGVDDLVGNVLELVASSLGSEDELVVRGGAYFFGAASCRSTNREIVPATLRDSTIGFRVCATPGEVH
jgi:formylglycine-generating enzyme required for sulfatase activity